MTTPLRPCQSFCGAPAWTQTTQQIAEFLGGELKGSADVVLEAVASLKNAGPSDLSYAEEKFHADARSSKAGCLLVKSGEFPGQTVILVAKSQARIRHGCRDASCTRVHRQRRSSIRRPSSNRMPSIGKGTRIGAGLHDRHWREDRRATAFFTRA